MGTAGQTVEIEVSPLAVETTSSKTVPHVCLVRNPILSTVTALNNEATPSIAFAYLAGYLKYHGYPTTIVDGIGEALNETWKVSEFPGFHCQGLTLNEIVERIPTGSSIIAFSCMFSGEWPIARNLIEMVRVAFPNALLIAGGEHISALAEYSLRDCGALDLVVRGEGEHTLLEIVTRHTVGDEPRDVAGVSSLDVDQTFIEGAAPPRIKNIDAIPSPHWPEGYMERFWEAGKSYGVQTQRDMPIMASRGCPYQCTFCSNPTMWTTRYILRNVEDLIDEIRTYVERYDITALQFYDLTAITKKKWTLEFCQRLKELDVDLRWSLPSGTRSEALDSEVLSLLRDTNCNYLVYAPESGSPETLEKIKKQIDLEKLTNSVLEAKRLGITVRTNLIIGFPHETLKNILETIRYGLFLAWKGADEVSINIFSPYPGTEIFNELVAAGQIDLNDDFFLKLTSLNSDYTSFNPLTCNRHMGPKQLALYRIGFMMLNYIIGYIRYPSRIVRTIRNVFFGTQESTTVLEHRLKDKFRRKQTKSGLAATEN
jgi:anaerobic magnesium-protoporphyrin IX monomethyl ester cyclase